MGTWGVQRAGDPARVFFCLPRSRWFLDDRRRRRALARLRTVSRGGILRLWPVFVLGPRFSGLVAIQRDHQLVTTGIYRYVRNPSYLGLLISSFGWALLFRSLVGVSSLLFCWYLCWLASDPKNNCWPTTLPPNMSGTGREPGGCCQVSIDDLTASTGGFGAGSRRFDPNQTFHSGLTFLPISTN